MEEKILKQLELAEKANAWFKSSLDGEKQKNACRNMVNCRRKLNKKRYALEGNPAAAMYGESQVGKSYLIGSLLSEEGKPFTVTGENGVVHNFIEEINPPGGGSESTSLVSRFSVNYKPENPGYPVKAVLLSPVDAVLVLCDSFYNDIKAVHDLTLRTDDINAEVFALKARLKDRQVRQKVFGEDDVLDMQDYFESNLTKAGNVLSSKFFDEISQLICKADSSEWREIFSLLWNKNEKITTLFSNLILEYEKLKFSTTIYLPVEAILYKHGTVLDVKRLKEIYEAPDRIESEYRADTTVWLPAHNEEIRFSKCYLCALAAELVFSQPELLLANKPFLKETDLLDFPGARSRLQLPENLIEAEIIPELMLRGKVAYLFNKYSEAEKINILLFCAKHEQAAQRLMPEMLNNWIAKIVGATPEKREDFISKSKIPPLFIIGTFFNVNLQYNPQQDKPADNSSLNYRWNQRFERTLAAQLLNTEIYAWFESWTVSQPYFRNIFLLRDFEKSDTISHIFRGYNENKTELEEVIPQGYPGFREKLRQSFIEYDFVKRHFANPAESWDEAASINKDGTKLIIDRLTAAAENINSARREKTLAGLNAVSEAILAELLRHFHSNDKDEELQKAKSTAGNIQHTLDMAFSADGIRLYGQLMKELMLDEGSVLELYRKKIDDVGYRDVVNMDIYSTYRIQVPVAENDTAGAYFERLCAHYEKTTEESKQKFREYLEAKQIDLEELINGNTDMIKSNAQQLADMLLEYWFAYVAQNDKSTIQQILAAEGSPALQDITEMFQKLFKKLGLAKRIAEKIRCYIDGHSKTELPYEIAADISAELLNKCINTVGFEYLDESELNDLRKANEQNNLGLILDRHDNPAEKSVEELLTKIENWADIIRSEPGEMKLLPSYRNYLSWYNRLKVGFVSVCDIPNYDVAANERLGNIINECKRIEY
ncbi:MAG: putative virulence factor [Chitinispirillia bacterium]|nr:putative virulence factor [Chitinispirillia bacterium]MCL2241064.1 putative virulence factor [Chitinispirillia bacterium]